jgi:hypothetical protein
VQITAEAGTVDQPQACSSRSWTRTNFTSLTSDAITLLDAFQLTIGRLAPGAQLGHASDERAANGLFVLARVLSESGVYGLEPVARLSSNGNGQLVSIEPAAEPKLPGFNGSGQYVLVQVAPSQILGSGHRA